MALNDTARYLLRFKALHLLGFKTPTQVQQAVIPLLLNRQDVVVKAQPILGANSKDNVMRTPHILTKLIKKGYVESPAPLSAPVATIEAAYSG